MTEKFNPHDEKYKKVEDLPVEHQGKYVNDGEGLIREEAKEKLSDAELEARIANTLKNQRVTSMDVLRKEANKKQEAMIIAEEEAVRKVQLIKIERKLLLEQFKNFSFGADAFQNASPELQ